jgi:hypothetical protein
MTQSAGQWSTVVPCSCSASRRVGSSVGQTVSCGHHPASSETFWCVPPLVVLQDLQLLMHIRRLLFQVYREINERNSSRSSHKKSYPSDDASRSEHRSFGFKGLSHSGLPTNDHGTFKPNGLIKKVSRRAPPAICSDLRPCQQTITVTIEGSDLHLISYYTSEDVRSGKLKRPSSRPDVMALPLPPHIFRLTNFRNPPKVDIGPDGKPRLVSVEPPGYHLSSLN